MKIAALILCSIIFSPLSAEPKQQPLSSATPQLSAQKNKDIVLNMFRDLTEKMDIDALNNYFSKDFMLYSNQANMDYGLLKKQLQDAFRVHRSIKVKQPINDIVAKDDRVIMHFTLIATDKAGYQKEIETMAIFQIQDGKIVRLWELTYPEWDTEYLLPN